MFCLTMKLTFNTINVSFRFVYGVKNVLTILLRKGLDLSLVLKKDTAYYLNSHTCLHCLWTVVHRPMVKTDKQNTSRASDSLAASSLCDFLLYTGVH